jgi:hypothetical protein
MTRTWRRMLSLALPAVLLAACAGEIAGPGGRRAPGVLLVSGWSGTVPLKAGSGESLEWNLPRESSDFTAPAVLVAPDTVEAGEPFEVTTNTIGMNGCWRSDGQTTARLGRTAIVKPYDSHSGSEVCTEILLYLAHSSTLVLEEPGEWTLRVDGRRLRVGDDAWEEPISAKRTIIVR